MDDTLRLKLNQMIHENNVTDQTQLIRELKHSVIIKKEVNKLLELMNESKNASYEEIRNKTMEECYIMFAYYTDIYNRIIKK
jgi:flagellar biosynthesis component FlhA